MTEQRVSSRYSRALLDLALNVKQDELVYSDIKKIAEVLASSRELRTMTASPIFQIWRKKQIYDQLFKDLEISKIVSDFILLLIDKRRGEIIPDIVHQFQIQYNIYLNNLPVEITSAIPMTDELKEKLLKKLADLTGKNILPTFLTEEKLQGGLTVRIDDWVFDGSLKNQLSDLYKNLAFG